MADSSSDEKARAIQLANTLPVEEVPAKLRCGMCNKLAVDAVKLLCCSTSICEPCSYEIPETCIVCTHSPTSPDDCMPDKKLRTTLRAFIKTKQQKQAKPAEPTPAPPAQEGTPALRHHAAEVAANDAKEAEAANSGINISTGEADTNELTESGEATTGASAADAQDQRETHVANSAIKDDPDQEEEEEDDDDDVVITVERPENEEELTEDQQHDEQHDGDYSDQQYGGHGSGQQMNHIGQNQQGYGYNNNTNNFGSMMGMQNGMGMGNFGMGMSNMMSMAGMGGTAGMNFDPSMMFPNGGFGSMGDMSAMMNMGMGGMNGMGGFGGMPGMNTNMGGGGSGGFFGPGNSGGYNHHQQFGNQVNAPFHQQRGYYNRGRGGFGRGRGGFYPRGGRGGFNAYNQYSAGQNSNYMNQQADQGLQFGSNNNSDYAQQQPDGRRGSPIYEPMAPSGGSNSVAPQKGNGEGDSTNEAVAGATNVNENQQHIENGDSAQAGVAEGGDVVHNAGGDASTNHAASGQHTQPLDQQACGYGAARGGFGAHGSAYGNVTTIGGESEPPPAPPVNAPKGPKAMLQGLPNSGRYSRPQQPSGPPLQVTESQAEGSQNRGRSRTKSRSPSRHESRKDGERTPIAERDSDEAYAERKERERERRQRKEREARDEREKDEGLASGDEKVNSRSEPLDNHEKRKHRERPDERRSSHRDRSREKRKHRDRSRSPDKTRTSNDESDRSRRKSKHDRRYDDIEDRAKDRHSSRKHSRREDDYEYDSKNRSKHSRSSKDDGKVRDRAKRHATPEAAAEEFGISIKGAAQNSKAASLDKGSMGPPSAPRSSRDDRRNSVKAVDPTPVASAQDQYAAEREAQIQKRLARHKDTSLGKRTSRTEDEIVGERRGKRHRQDTRRHSARFE